MGLFSYYFCPHLDLSLVVWIKVGRHTQTFKHENCKTKLDFKIFVNFTQIPFTGSQDWSILLGTNLQYIHIIAGQCLVSVLQGVFSGFCCIAHAAWFQNLHLFCKLALKLPLFLPSSSQLKPWWSIFSFSVTWMVAGTQRPSGWIHLPCSIILFLPVLAPSMPFVTLQKNNLPSINHVLS